jgi:hypothetical protein
MNTLRNQKIMDAYRTALDQIAPDDADRDAIELAQVLPRIFRTVPDTSITEILMALRWGAQQEAEIVALRAKAASLEGRLVDTAKTTG